MIEFNFNTTDNSRTARIRNKTENSFEIKVDNYLNSFTGSTEVDYIVMEAGDWVINNGAGGFRVVAATRWASSFSSSDSFLSLVLTPN